MSWVPYPLDVGDGPLIDPDEFAPEPELPKLDRSTQALVDKIDAEVEALDERLGGELSGESGAVDRPPVQPSEAPANE